MNACTMCHKMRTINWQCTSCRLYWNVRKKKKQRCKIYVYSSQSLFYNILIFIRFLSIIKGIKISNRNKHLKIFYKSYINTVCSFTYHPESNVHTNTSGNISWLVNSGLQNVDTTIWYHVGTKRINITWSFIKYFTKL